MNIVVPPHTGEGTANQRPAAVRNTHPTAPISPMDSGQEEGQRSSYLADQAGKGPIQNRDGLPGREERDANTPLTFTDGLTNLKNGLSEAELSQLRELKNRDREVHAHESAHVASAGPLASGGASFTHQRGPDGKLYAVGGEVNIDTAPVPGNPAATVDKAQRIQRAALAPAQPSSQDRAVAVSAAAMETRARAEIAAQAAQQSLHSETTTAAVENSVEADAGRGAESGATEETQAACPLCGGKHSAAGHTAMVEQRVSDTFAYGDHQKPGNVERLGSLLSVTI